MARATLKHEAAPIDEVGDRRVEKPAGLREFSPRAILCGFAVAAVMGASYPYIVLKLGFGPNVSVVAAFFGYLALGIVFKDYNRWENNIVQTAGTAAAQTAFMCVLLAAFDMLAASNTVSFNVTLSPLQSFAWLTSAGLLGVLLAVPMRQHFIVDQKLTYADGLAAGQTLIVLDGRGAEARTAAWALAIGGVASAAVMLMTEDALVLKWFPSVMLLGSAVTMTTGVGINWSLLSLGSGMLVGLRINASMLLGTAVAWVVAPYALLHYGIITEQFTKNDVLFWVMWPATGMMVCGGLAGLVLRWRILLKTFHSLSAASVGSEDFPLKWVGVGVVITSVALIVVQKVSLGLDIWMTVVAILLSLPLMLVGLRVLGETNWGPISAMSNMMQGIFGILAPGHIPANMLASGTTGTIAWRLRFSKLTGRAIAAHIHVGRVGRAGPVLVALCGPCRNGQRGTANLTAAALAALEAGRGYVNVHTPKNAGGEIRGQIRSVPLTTS